MNYNTHHRRNDEVSRAIVDETKRDSLGNKPICLSCKFFDTCEFLLKAVKESDTPSVAFLGACNQWKEE